MTIKSQVAELLICFIPLIAVWTYGAEAGIFILLAAIFLRLGHIQEALENANKVHSARSSS